MTAFVAVPLWAVLVVCLALWMFAGDYFMRRYFMSSTALRPLAFYVFAAICGPMVWFGMLRVMRSRAD